jgi:hypothetical protein
MAAPTSPFALESVRRIQLPAGENVNAKGDQISVRLDAL